MPDPVTNLQIEDVLSSIRKLVSENNRAEAGMSAAAKTAKRESEAAATSTAGVAAGAQQAPDRLLLTPSLRVEDQAEDEGEEAGDFDLEAALAEAEADTTTFWYLLGEVLVQQKTYSVDV